MIDEEIGNRNKKGDWKPSYLFSYGPLFELPFRPLTIIKWIFSNPGYILPWLFFYGLIGLIVYLFFTPNPVSGDVSVVTDVQDIKRSVRNLVMTSRFDRPFHPEINSHVRDLLFERFTPITFNLLRQRIETILENYEPRVRVTDIQIDDSGQMMDNNELNVRVFFTLKNKPQTESVDIMLERVR